MAAYLARSTTLNSTLFGAFACHSSSLPINRNQDHDDVGCPEYSDGSEGCAGGGTLRSLGKDVSSLCPCPWDDATTTRETACSCCGCCFPSAPGVSRLQPCAVCIRSTLPIKQRSPAGGQCRPGLPTGSAGCSRAAGRKRWTLSAILAGVEQKPCQSLTPYPLLQLGARAAATSSGPHVAKVQHIYRGCSPRLAGSTPLPLTLSAP